jgi:hypothetical protein
MRAESYPYWFAKPAYGVAYLQLSGLYKQLSFEKRNYFTLQAGISTGVQLPFKG